LMCTTVPPAKSSTPADPRKPPPQTQWAIGQYTNSSHSDMNRISAENFIRSANEPQISAGVMIAKVIWKHMNTDSGMVAASEFTWPIEPDTSTRDAGPLQAPIHFWMPASGLVVKASE